MTMTVDDALMDVGATLQMTTAMLIALIKNAPNKDILATRFVEIERALMERPEGEGPMSRATRLGLRTALGIP